MTRKPRATYPKIVEKIRIANTGKKRTEQVCKKIGLSKVGKRHQSMCVPIEVFGKRFECINEAAKQLLIPQSNLSRWVIQEKPGFKRLT
jgi:hypothetical protein